MLTENDIYEVLCETLPKQNDFYKSVYSEELQELFHFGITTRLQLLDMIAKHKEKALSIDCEPLDDYEIQLYSKEYGKGYVNERVERKFWYAYPALLRIILELEFGDRYRDYANKRDGL
jgi:hypothetical protein